MSTRRIQPCRNQDCSSFWPRSCCQFFSSIKFHSTFPQRPAQVPTLVMLVRIVSIASIAPKKAGSAVFVSSVRIYSHFIRFCTSDKSERATLPQLCQSLPPRVCRVVHNVSPLLGLIR